jgi:high-affinity Fe2+/Pb2+ permease
MAVSSPFCQDSEYEVLQVLWDLRKAQELFLPQGGSVQAALSNFFNSIYMIFVYDVLLVLREKRI